MAQEKPTFVSLLGLQAAQNYANQLLAQALNSVSSIASLEPQGVPRTAALQALARLLVQRTH